MHKGPRTWGPVRRHEHIAFGILACNGKAQPQSNPINNLEQAQEMIAFELLEKYGRYWTRTSDILLVREALYQLS